MESLKNLHVLKPGLYRHYKGKFYQVIELGRHSESLETVVIYRALYDDYELWVRPLSMFLEDVDFNGFLEKRFTFVSETIPSDFKEHSTV